MAFVWDAMDVLPRYVCEMTGAELSGVRLFITLIYIYPISLFQRKLLTGANANIHHVYHFLTAAFLGYYNFGTSSAFFLINVLVAYLLMVIFSSSKHGVIASLILNLGYLGYGYGSSYSSEEVQYVILWTTPHCVLTLKLIGLAWDVYDGAQEDTKGKEETAAASVPTFLELLGFACYLPSLLTGPQISFMKYKRFTEGVYDEYLLSDSGSYGLLRLIIGIGLLLSYALLGPYLPTGYFFTEGYVNLWLPTKIVSIAIWGQLLLMRYLGVWLIAEGSCVLSGIAFKGKDEAGNLLWNASANVKLSRYFTATRSQHFIEGFNINTNKWVLMYVFKRLKFLNNRNISQGVALFFLAAWHGVYSGYFMCFFLEFIIMNGEKQIAELCEKKKVLKAIVTQPLLNPIFKLLTKFISTFTLGYALISFEQLRSRNYMPIYANTYYIAHIFYLICPLVYMVLSKVLANEKPAKPKQQ